MRKSLDETPVFLEFSKKTEKNTSQLMNNFRDAEIRKRMFLLFFCISSSGAILFFCFQVYTSIFLKTTVNLPEELVDQLCIAATIGLFPLTILAGWLSDKVGRKPIIVSGLLLGALTIRPGYLILGELSQAFLDTGAPGNLLAICLVLIALEISLALLIGPQSAILAELFPARGRNSAATLTHNIAAGWIGGLLPFIITWLNQIGGSALSGLWYPTCFLLIASVIAIFKLPETRFQDLGPT
jgi:MFS family permease